MGLLQLVFLSLALGISLASMEAGVQQEGSSQGTNTEVNSSQSEGKALLGNIRQLTFDGRRSGEGYFSRDGLRFIFQSEREDGNPFFQIYVMDRVEGKVRLLSPGYGKTTCGWIHPSGKKVLFSSTHEDPSAREKQKQELKQFKSSTISRLIELNLAYRTRKKNEKIAVFDFGGGGNSGRR